MKPWPIWILLTVMLVFPAVPVGAEKYIYQYVDKNGNTVFTDDLGNVPEEYLPRVGRRDYIPSGPDQGAAAAGTRAVPTGPGTTPGATWERKMKSRTGELEREKSSLERRFQQLQDQLIRLGEPPPPSAPASEIRAYRQEVEAINRQIDTYERQRLEFEEKNRAFWGGLAR